MSETWGGVVFLDVYKHKHKIKCHRALSKMTPAWYASNKIPLKDKDQKFSAKFHPYFYIHKYKIPSTLHVAKALS